METLNTTSGISQVERVGPSSVKYTAADDISYLIDLDLFESPNVQILIAEHRAKDEICPMPLDKVELLGKSISSKVKSLANAYSSSSSTLIFFDSFLNYQLADFLEVSLTEKLKFVLDISLLPIAVLRDFVMMANIEVDERPDRRMEFCIRSPGSTMFSYLPPLGAFGVLIDRPNNRLQIMVSF